MRSFRSTTLRSALACALAAAVSANATAATAASSVKLDSLDDEIAFSTPRLDSRALLLSPDSEGTMALGDVPRALPFLEYDNDYRNLSIAKQAEYQVLNKYVTHPVYTPTQMRFSDMLTVKTLSVTSRCSKDNIGDINEALRRVTFAVNCQIPYTVISKALPANYGSCLLYDRTPTEQAAYNTWKTSEEDPSLDTMPGCTGTAKPNGKAQFTSMWVGDDVEHSSPFVPQGTIPASLSECTSRGLVPPGLEIKAVCGVGCYAPEQRILFASGETPIEEAVSLGKQDLITLDPAATRGDIKLIQNKIENYTADIASAHQKLVSIHTASGGNLRVTSGHPLVLENGNLTAAGTLHIGDKLVRADGKSDEIVFVEIEDFYGKVYNLNPVTTDATSNIVVAEGYLNGSHRVQTKELDYEKRRFLRDAEVGAQ